MVQLGLDFEAWLGILLMSIRFYGISLPIAEDSLFHPLFLLCMPIFILPRSIIWKTLNVSFRFHKSLMALVFGLSFNKTALPTCTLHSVPLDLLEATHT